MRSASPGMVYVFLAGTERRGAGKFCRRCHAHGQLAHQRHEAPQHLLSSERLAAACSETAGLIDVNKR